MEKNFETKGILVLLIVGLLLRLIAIYLYSDEVLTNEWAVIIKNFKLTGTFGVNVVQDDLFAIPTLANEGDKVLPTIYMPPLYYYLIYVIDLLFDNFSYITNYIIILQTCLSLISIFLFYKIIRNLEKNTILIFIATSIFAFFPLNVYVSSQISSITLQIFLLLNFIFFLTEYLKKKTITNLIFFSFFSALLILTRAEFILFYFLTILFFFIYFKKNFKSLFFSILFTILIISPYIYRNYITFNEITITKSFGYNLLKGNNPNFKVEGSPEFIEENFPRNKLNIKTDKYYEIKLDNFYKSEALKIIKNDYLTYFKFYLKKVYSFIFFNKDSTYSDYFNFMHIIPKIIISILSFIAAILLIRKKSFYQYLSFYYFTNIFLFSVFFILPRYSLILLPIQLLLSIQLINILRGKFFN